MAPVIKTAECGSMTRAAQTMGYTQPSLGYIINNIENELGVKIFYRDQRGVTLTEAGVGLLEIMRQIEAMEMRLQEAARVSKWELLLRRNFFRRGGPVDARNLRGVL